MTAITHVSKPVLFSNADPASRRILHAAPKSTFVDSNRPDRHFVCHHLRSFDASTGPTQSPLPATATLPTPIPAQAKPQLTAAPATLAVQDPTAVSQVSSETPVDDTQSSIDARVEELLSQLTLAEKIGQMTQVESDSITPDEVTAYAVGSVLTGGSGAARRIRQRAG